MLRLRAAALRSFCTLNRPVVAVVTPPDNPAFRHAPHELAEFIVADNLSSMLAHDSFENAGMPRVSPHVGVSPHEGLLPLACRGFDLDPAWAAASAKRALVWR